METVFNIFVAIDQLKIIRPLIPCDRIIREVEYHQHRVGGLLLN